MESVDRLITAAGREDYERMTKLLAEGNIDPPVVITGDPLPPPFDFDEEEDGRVIPLTYDRLLALIEWTNKAMERLGR